MKDKEYLEALKQIPLSIESDEKLEEFIQPLYIIEDEMQSKERYIHFIEKMKVLNRATFPFTYSKHLIRYKFYRKDTKIRENQLRHFLINIFIWYPFIEIIDCPDVLNDEVVMDCSEIQKINEFINNNVINVLSKYNVSNIKINKYNSEINANLLELSGDMAVLLGSTLTIKDFIDMYRNNATIRGIMTSDFKENAQPAEMEEQMAEEQALLIKTLKEDERGNAISNMLNAGAGVKHKQLYEFMGKMGLKADLNKKTFTSGNANPVLIGGMQKPSDTYREATGSRKSQVQNHSVMGKAGGFARKACLLAESISMSTTVSDCGSKHLVPYIIKNEKILKMLDGKFYKINDDDDLRMLSAKKDKDLIGKTVKVRSIATCALNNGKICPTCIGKIAKWNYDIPEGLFIFLTQEWTEPLQQNILSTKHLLTTNSEKISFTDPNEFFEFRGASIHPLIKEDKRKVPNIEDYAIVILPEDLQKEEEFDYDSMYNTYIHNGRFFIKNLKTPGDKMTEITIEPRKELYITEEYMQYFMKKGNMLKFKDIEDDDIPIFEINIANNELTKPLYDLMALVDKNDDEQGGYTIESFSQTMVDIFADAGFRTNVASCECMINRLIRCYDPEDPGAIYRRPDFRKKKLEPYQIITIRKALEYHPSPLVGMSSLYVRRQIMKDDFFRYRTEPSYIDKLFQEDISTKPFTKFREMREERINNGTAYDEDGNFLDD